MKTFFAKKEEVKQKEWCVVDAQNQILGRLASKVARILMGKDRTEYTPHTDTGRGVIIVNASKIRVTGTKLKTKIYTSFSGYPGGLKERPLEWMMQKDPTFAVKHAVKGMVPKNNLGKKMMTHLLVYPGADHPHKAQHPDPIKLSEDI